MKRTQKLLTVLILLVVVCLSLSLISFASDEGQAPEGVTDTESTQTGNTEDLTGSEDTSLVDTVIGIVTAAVGEKFMSVASVVINVVLLFILALIKRTLNTSVTDIARVLTKTDSSVKEKWEEIKELTKSESAAIEAFKSEVSKRIDHRFEAMLKELEGLIKAPGVSHEQLAEVVELEKAQLEIFDTIYQHSSTIPTSTKEKLTLIHNDALKKAARLEAEDAQYDAEEQIHNA